MHSAIWQIPECLRLKTEYESKMLSEWQIIENDIHPYFQFLR